MKILIGCPTSDRYLYCLELWLKRVKEIIAHNKDNQIDYLLVDNSKSIEYSKKLKERGINVVHFDFIENVRERIAESRNVLRDKVLNEGYDYFLSLEQDIIPPIDIVDTLVKQNKEIISAYYGKPITVEAQDVETGEIKKFDLEIPVVYLQEGNQLRRANANEVLNKGTIQVGGFGVGCLLIKSDVLRKIGFHVDEKSDAFDDIVFCKDAKSEGYKLYLDSNTVVEHLHIPW